MDNTYNGNPSLTVSEAPVEQRHLNRMDLVACDGHYTITPEVASRFLGINPQKLRDIARTEEGRIGLGFPVIVAGRTILIPKLPFLRFFGYEGQVELE